MLQRQFLELSRNARLGKELEKVCAGSGRRENCGKGLPFRQGGDTKRRFESELGLGQRILQGVRANSG